MSFTRRIARADAKIQHAAMRPLDEAVVLAAMFDDPEPVMVGAHAGVVRTDSGPIGISTARWYTIMADRAAAGLDNPCNDCMGRGHVTEHGHRGTCATCGGSGRG